MSGKMVSYDYVNDKRDLGDLFTQIVQSKPTLSNLFSVVGKATNTKHEWLEDVVTPSKWTLDAAYTIAGGSITLLTTAGSRIGDVIQFELPTGARATVQLRVTAITSSTVLAVAVYGWTTDVNMATASIATLMSRPKNESTSATADDGYEPVAKYNCTQIFDRTAKVSKTSVEIPKFGIGWAMNYQVDRQLQNLAYDIGNTTINMSRVTRTDTAPGSMGWFMWFLKQAIGNVVDASAAALSGTILNNAFEIGADNGADNMVTLACAPNQARRLSAFNTAGNNPVLSRSETTTGSYVLTFVSDQGHAATIVADRNFDKDKVAIIDPSRINIVPLRAFTDENAAGNGDDFYARRILGEYTMEVKNAAECHVYITNLAI